MPIKEASIRLMQMSGIRHFRVGTNKIFMRQDDLDLLEGQHLRSIANAPKNNFLQTQFETNKENVAYFFLFY